MTSDKGPPTRDRDEIARHWLGKLMKLKPATGMRVPLMHGFPRKTAGSLSIWSRQFIREKWHQMKINANLFRAPVTSYR